MLINFSDPQTFIHRAIGYPPEVRYGSVDWVECNCRYISAVLNQSIDITNGDEVAGKIEDLMSLGGLIAENEAKAKAIYEERSSKIFLSLQDKPATYIKYAISSEANQEFTLMVWSERLGRNWTHTMDGLRSILSKIKAEIEKGL